MAVRIARHSSTSSFRSRARTRTGSNVSARGGQTRKVMLDSLGLAIQKRDVTRVMAMLNGDTAAFNLRDAVGIALESDLLDIATKIADMVGQGPIDVLKKASSIGCFSAVVELLKDDSLPVEGMSHCIVTAARKNHVNIVKAFLLDARSDPSACNNFLIRWAAQIGSLDTVRLLLKDTRVNIHANDHAPFLMAARHGHIDVMRLLLVHKGEGDSFGRNEQAFLVACQKGQLEVVRWLMDTCNLDPSCQNGRAVQMACTSQNEELVKFLLSDDRVDPSSLGNSALVSAVNLGCVEIAKMLLSDSRVTVSGVESKIFDEVAKRGSRDMATLLLGLGVDDEIAVSTFITACRVSNFEVVKVLLDLELVDPSCREQAGFKLVCENGSVDLVRLLLQDERVQPGRADNESIVTACTQLKTDVVRVLMEDGRCNPGARNNLGICAASEKGADELVELLLADPRVDPSEHNNYCLDGAVSSGSLATVRIILKDPRVAPNGKNNLPLRSAVSKGYKAIVELLLEDPRVDPTACVEPALKNAPQEILEILALLPQVQHAVAKFWRDPKLRIMFKKLHRDMVQQAVECARIACPVAKKLELELNTDLAAKIISFAFGNDLIVNHSDIKLARTNALISDVLCKVNK
uniref:Uncharacterized protein n=2 Tax=Mucochytrium quahogii TaxID=96639 RepID=A0A7S2RSQ2_9STRA|mmetsp:Transcript_6237/g.9859  ORF Transcript_6237/g.9859 Transcript_6237/m.9859 type:complete len:635 (+) Transcript_6237:213-2117(+)